jgi:hypothetical protein
VEKYDLEILTDDWTKYDANSAIVKTSKLSPEDITRFVNIYDTGVSTAWEEMVRGYHEKTNPPEIDLRVESHFRLRLVYRILSEDLIGKVGIIPVDSLGKTDDLLEQLCRRIENETEVDGELVSKTIRRFAASGYIKSRISGDECRWYWTHNNHVDRLPDLTESARD